MSYVIVTAALVAKPVPDTDTRVPAGPESGEITIVGETVKVAVALFPNWPMAVTACVPAADPVTVNEAANAPVELVVIDDGVVDIAFPPYVNVIAEFGAKLVPVTFTLEPTGPVEGLSEIEEASGSTVNWTLAVLLRPSLPAIMWAPTLDEGTVKVAVNPPVEFDVGWAGVVTSRLVS